MRTLAAVMALAVFTVGGQAQQQPRFRSTVDLLVVSTIVRNADNTLARGLTQDDFELLEDGKPVAIATFAEANIGRAVLFNPTPSRADLRGHVAQTIGDTSRANVTTYVVDPLGLGEKPGLSPGAIDAGGLPNDGPGTISKSAGFQLHESGFSYETGGRVFANTNLFEQAINQVWEESGNYYLLGYEPAKRDNKRHTIEVRVKKPDVQVRARRTRG